MFKLHHLFPALILAVAAPSISEAQSMPSQGTYKVQVQVEHWFYGTFSWRTFYETNSREEAELVFTLLENAFENGNIYDFVRYDGVWFVRDIRLILDRKIPVVHSPNWTAEDLYRYLYLQPLPFERNYSR